MKLTAFTCLSLLLCLCSVARGEGIGPDVSDRFVSTVEPAEVHYQPDELVKRDEADLWQANRKFWGYGGQTIWLRAVLDNTADQPQTMILSLPYSSPSQADYFIYDASGQKVKTVHAGTFSPIEGRDLKLNMVGVQLDFPQKSQLTVLIRQKSKSLLDTHYMLRPAAEHRELEWIYLVAYGIYFGLALALFVHNLSLYFSVGDHVYLAYLGFVVCVAATMLFSSSYYALFWYRLPSSLHNVIYATPAFLNIGAAYFTCQYLHLRPSNSWLARGFCLLSGVSLVVVLIHLYRPEIAMPLNTYLNLAAIALAVSACLLRILQGERYAWFLLAAVLSPMASVVAYYAGTFWLNVSVPSDIIFVAFAVEMLLMSIGLAHRVYILRLRQHHLQSQQATLIHQSKMRALSDMASGVAHEVNNPLMIIGGYADIIRRLANQETIDVVKVKDYTSRIDHNVSRIAFIVHALRSFAQDDQEQTRENIVLKEVIEQALALCSSRIQNRGIRLELDLTTDALCLHAMRSQLLEILLSLLDNAVEALQDAPEKVITIQTQSVPESQRIRVVILDSGPGVRPELVNRLFQPFFTTRLVGEGAGLSLSRCLGIVHSISGDLYYERHNNVTRFVMELPSHRP